MMMPNYVGCTAGPSASPSQSSLFAPAYGQNYAAEPNYDFHLYPHHHQQQPPASFHLSSPSLPNGCDFGGSYYYQQNGPATSLPEVVPTVPAVSAYPHDFSPHQTHDCYGVPAHPSVSEYPLPQLQPPPPAQYLNQQLPFATQQLVPLPQQQHHHHHNHHDYYDHQDYGTVVPGKSVGYNSRQMRNMAEKLRRDKLNTCINELSQLVPMISNSSKKIEKTSVLRLSASFLRLNRLLTGFKDQGEPLPGYINEINLADLILDDSDIYLMVTSLGKIVFVSHSVESILGHPQIDLMGQSLFTITFQKDHDELENNLKYHDNASSSNIVANSTTNSDRGEFKMQRRSFYLRLLKKAASRNETPEFELVHVVGALMKQNPGKKNSMLGANDIVLNAVVRPFNERRVTEISMLEATREEYITRHRIDSRIIYVDHRISIVSGFMPQEVSGQLAFTYMHKDDVRWVMIALRQMYFKGQSYGCSCYRLLSKNGDFVYMMTHGYLELNPNEDSVESFICVNTLVSPEEGIKEIKKMRERFTPLIHCEREPGMAAITNNQLMEGDSAASLSVVNASTEDPSTINVVVEQMIQNIPDLAIENVINTQKRVPDSQYEKVLCVSKSLPPVPPSSKAPKIERQPSMSPKLDIKPITQNRPTVLVAPPPNARQPVVVYNQQTNEKSAEKDREYYERRGGILVGPKRHNDLQYIPDRLPKKAKLSQEIQIDSPTCSLYSNQMDGSQSDNQLSPDGCGSLDKFPSFQDTPIPFSHHSIDESDINLGSFSDVNMTGLDHFSKTLNDNDSAIDSLFLTPESCYSSSYDNGVYAEGSPLDNIQDPIMHVLQHDGSVESDLLEKKQTMLKTKMDQQQGQLKEIQTELNSLSSNADTQFLTTNFSNLKAVHEQQQQMLLKLKGVHQNIGVMNE